MTQSTILLTTLAVMLGLGVGYWFGYIADPRRPIRIVIKYMIATSSLLTGMYKTQLDLAAMIKGGHAYER